MGDSNLHAKESDSSTSPEHTYHESTPSQGKRTPQYHLVLSFIGGILWLGPAIWILYSNLSGYVIGGNIWCPMKNCGVITLSLPTYKEGTNSVDNAVEADRQAHNLLGALQFAAKALEIWFIIIAGSLVYNVSWHLANGPGGLPIGYLLAHMKFADVRSIFNPVSWVSAWPSRKGDYRPRICGFLFLLVSLSVISNFIGPLTAVLLNPSLDWDNGEPAIPRRFGQMLSQGPIPVGTLIDNDYSMRFCRENNIIAGDYRCFERYGQAADALCENVEASIRQGDPEEPQGGQTIIWYDYYSSESQLRFSFNITPPSGEENLFNTASYSPNRQLIRGLASDIWKYMDYTFNSSSPAPTDAFGSSTKDANNSVQLEIQRQGPLIGSTYLLAHGIPYTADIVDTRRQIRCFDRLPPATDNPQVWAKCYRYGNWSDKSSQVNLTLQRGPSEKTNLQVYWSDQVAWFTTEDFQSWRANCIRVYDSMNDYNATDSTCQWSERFSRTPPDNVKSSGAGLVTEYRRNETQRADPQTGEVFFSDFNPTVTNATYSVDVTDIFSSPMEVKLAYVPIAAVEDRHPIVLNASWARVTWASLNDTVEVSDRFAARSTHNAINGAYDNLNNVPPPPDFIFLRNMAQMVGLHMLSLPPYETMGELDSSDDINNPILKSYFHRQVWKYGTDQRTRKFGIGVTIIGCIVVIARSILVLALPKAKPESIELVRAMMEHIPRGEFDSLNGTDNDQSKGRWGSWIRSKKRKWESGRVKFSVKQINEKIKFKEE